MQYSREDACRAWLAYGELRHSLMHALLEEYQTAENIYDAFVRTNGMLLDGRASNKQKYALQKHASKDAMHAMLLTMRSKNIGVLTSEDYLYPDSLRNLSDPPMTLFYQGALEVMTGRCLTIVGSRKASVEGIAAAVKIGKELSASGVVIVSGMASGIDAAAHRGSIEGGTPGVGLLSCGLDVDYPVENRRLKEKLLYARGTLLSEYAPGTPALGYHFAARNRILSGLSRAVIVMEASIRSGTMTTVQHALDQGRDVFAYPGRPDSPWSEGAHELIREGARYFTSSSDILEDMGWNGIQKQTQEEKAALPQLTPQQHLVLSTLTQGEKSMDELANMTKLDTAELGSALTMLQLMGLIQAQPGNAFRII